MGRIKQWGRLHKIELGVFALAFGLRVLYSLFVQLYAGPDGFIAFSDAKAFYYREALNLVAGNGFSIANEVPFYPNAYHTPLYPLFVAFFYFLNLSTFVVILAQCLLAGGMTVLFYRIAELLTKSKKIALLTGILAAVEPMSIYWCALLMSDTLFSFLLVASFYFLFQRKYIPTAIFLGLAILTRPIALYFLPVYVLYVAYEAYVAGSNFRGILRNMLVVLVLTAAIVSPWYARNKIVFGTWSLSSAGWYNLYSTSVREFVLEKGEALPPAPVASEAPDSFTRFSFVYTPFYHDTVLQIIKNDFLQFVVFEIKRTFSSFFASKYWYLLHYVAEVKFPNIVQALPAFMTYGAVLLGDLAWILIYAVALIALVKPSLRVSWIFAFMVVGINAALSGIIDPVGPQMTRYSMPFFGFYFAFAAVGFSYLFEILRSTVKPEKR